MLTGAKIKVSRHRLETYGKVNKAGLHRRFRDDIIMYTDKQGDGITIRIFLKLGQFYSQLVVTKLILLFSSNSWSVQPSLKNIAHQCRGKHTWMLQRTEKSNWNVELVMFCSDRELGFLSTEMLLRQKHRKRNSTRKTEFRSRFPPPSSETQKGTRREKANSLSLSFNRVSLSPSLDF